MTAFSNRCIQIAAKEDISSLLNLLNNAYRGESLKRGWTSEAHLIAGEVRTDANTLLELIEKPGSVILKYVNGKNEIIGCVNLQKHDEKIYLGMLAVSPNLQGGGVGKQLLISAEEYARNKKCNSVYMTVISLRTELINWYIKNGYSDTGKRKPFNEDGLTGKHLQPLEFMELEKRID